MIYKYTYIMFAIRFPWWLCSWSLPAVSSRTLLSAERHGRAKWPVCRRLLLSCGPELWESTTTCLLSGTLLWEGQPSSLSLQAIISHHCWILHVISLHEPSSLAVSCVLSWQLQRIPLVNWCFPPFTLRRSVFTRLSQWYCYCCTTTMHDDIKI